jgi:uncharacterized protein
MFITVKELELRKVSFDEAFPPGAIDLGQEVEQTTPLLAAGRVELVREDRGGRDIVEDIRLVGRFSTKLVLPCSRCLEPVAQAVAEAFDLLYRPLGADASGKDASIGLAEMEIGYYQGDGILLEDVLKEQVLLDLPVKLLCRADCQGLCPHCGKNRNTESCNCASNVSDPRWAALGEISKKLER